MLYDYFLHHFDLSVRNLQFFVIHVRAVIRFIHALVHRYNRFDSVKVTFPIRGHSYMECDKDMGLINKKVHVETPEDWNEHIRRCRVRPFSFYIIDVPYSRYFHNMDFIF